jgi:geranylgeranyl diphosphate synthase type I
MSHYQTLLGAVSQRAERVRQYLLDPVRVPSFLHPHLSQAILSYPQAGGKSLRPAVLLFSCGAVGGDESLAIPAAAAVELYHTWTLVHDDIIDRDERRRGVPTVHAQYRQVAQDELGFEPAKAAHYGLSVAILTGDMQQGWCVSLLTALSRENHVAPELTINLIHHLFSQVQATLVDGEALDILYAETPIEKLNAQMVLEMLWKKTGVLYDFAGRAGAAIGLDQPDLRHPDVERIAAFTGRCGIAFQIQDDILGVVGDEKTLGKAVGADIREGKRTLVVLGSLPNMTPAERQFALSILGNTDVELNQVQEVIDLLRQRGGVDSAQRTACELVENALTGLDTLPESEAKSLLLAWGKYLIEREF